MAQSSGGIVVTRGKDLAAAIEQIAAAASEYYLLEYYWGRPPLPAPEVKVRRPGVVVTIGAR